MKHFGDNIISFLKNASVKLEEFQLQSTLGKAELNDKFEEMKKETRVQYLRIKNEINSTVEKDKEKWNQLRAKLQHLELQLTLAKAETIDAIEEQKKNLSKAFQDVKKLIPKN